MQFIQKFNTVKFDNCHAINLHCTCQNLYTCILKWLSSYRHTDTHKQPAHVPLVQAHQGITVMYLPSSSPPEDNDFINFISKGVVSAHKNNVSINEKLSLDFITIKLYYFSY